MTNIIQLQNNIAYKYHEINPEKETIVFLHDSLGCITLWRDFPKLLGEKTGCNILMYDRLGYGKSGNFIKDSRDNFYMEDEADVLKGDFNRT